MSAAGATDPVDVGQLVAEILATGLKTATYKFATLLALIDHCVENFRLDDRAATLDVPLKDLADRVIRIYWSHVLPFEGFGHPLEQTTDKAKGLLILKAVAQLRKAAGADKHEMSLDTARKRIPKEEYQKIRRDVIYTLVDQPLKRLQRLPQAGHRSAAPESFLHDDTWMQKPRVKVQAIKDNGSKIVLQSGVAYALARLSELLKPVLRLHWIEEVRDMNSALHRDEPDVEGYLFGRDRIPLERAGRALKDHFGSLCFYCEIRPATEVDHVLPWSLFGIDGLANLVPACGTCNLNKLQSVPAIRHVKKALTRDHQVLDTIDEAIDWSPEYRRVMSTARGMYLSRPDYSPTWSAVNDFTPLDPSERMRFIEFFDDSP